MLPAAGSDVIRLDLVWLIIPAAVGIFTLRVFFLARRLRLAAGLPTLTDRRALREARNALDAHRDHLSEAVAAPGRHLAAAKRLGRSAMTATRPPKGLDAMVEDFLPERRL